MIIVERGTNIVFPVHSLSLKKLILHKWEKDYAYLDWCLITLITKLTKILTRKKNATRFVLFQLDISVGVRAVLRFLVSKKNLAQCKKLPWDKFVKKKIILQNILWYAKGFRITMFSWSFSWFFRMINVRQYFFEINVLLDGVDMGLGHEGKHFIRYHFCHFFIKAVMDEFN